MTFKNLSILLILCFWISLVFSQETTAVISNIDKELISKRKTFSEVLTDTALMYLHSLTPFREVIKRNAKPEEVSIAPPNEPGVRIVVNGTVTNASGKPLEKILLYFYHTSDKGWYSDTGVHILLHEGDHKHARLFGYVKTDAQGRFKIYTIRPNGYPKTDLAAHIHIQMWKDDGAPLSGIPGELQFADDVRMTEARRKKSIEEGFLIADNAGSKQRPVYNYLIKSIPN
ncbi:MAG TPA: hypothetical protein VNV85_07845 [Puia sp.]|jgi:protocatechuate 3,4-dioxygenase beta subunit|nr:hypothetical protein [Puia sp.]